MKDSEACSKECCNIFKVEVLKKLYGSVRRKGEHIQTATTAGLLAILLFTASLGSMVFGSENSPLPEVVSPLPTVADVEIPTVGLRQKAFLEKVSSSQERNDSRGLASIRPKSAANFGASEIDPRLYREEIHTEVYLGGNLAETRKTGIAIVRVAPEFEPAARQRGENSCKYDGRLERLSFMAPVYPEVSSAYGDTRCGGRFHTGVDFYRPMGETIVAAEGGEVTFAGYAGTYGLLVILDHGMGVETYYSHCDTMNVSVGDIVEKGVIIGTVGNTGHTTGAHLHFEVRIGGRTVDPMDFIEEPEMRNTERNEAEEDIQAEGT